MESIKLYNKVLRESTPVGIRSMENIKKVCDLLDQEGVSITIAVVCRELNRQNISPKAQTIRNSKNLRSYIKMRSNEQVVKSVKLTGNDKLLELINQYKRENEALRTLLKNISLKIFDS